MLKFNLIRDRALSHQPTRAQLDKWLRASLQRRYTNSILSISIVNIADSQTLNNEYRGINKSTNVISLEYPDAREAFNLLSGELILCDDVIVSEANDQQKSILAHYAHMLIHGTLHLQGYDHQNEQDAEAMETIEVEIMAKLGFRNPYLECNN